MPGAAGEPGRCLHQASVPGFPSYNREWAGFQLGRKLDSLWGDFHGQIHLRKQRRAANAI